MRNLFTITLILFIANFNSSLFGQDDETVEALYALRRTQASANQDYASTEKSIVEKGIYPPALVDMSTSSAEKSFQFRTYKDISVDKQDRIEQRLMVSVTGLHSVEIDNQQVNAIFSSDATEENILLFFKLLGYNNYELK